MASYDNTVRVILL